MIEMDSRDDRIIEKNLPGETADVAHDVTTADCYSAGERASMERYQRLRGDLLAPLLRLFTQIGVSPDNLTFLSLICGLAFCPIYYWSPAIAFLALLMHLILDALDGPLARFQGVASRAGSFTDTFCDQIVVAVTTGFLMPSPINIWAGVSYVFLYTLVVVFAMVRNALGIPYSWLLRPRIVVYVALALEILCFHETGWEGSVNVLLWLVNCLLALKLASGFWRLKKRL